MRIAPNFIDLTGQKFHQLTVIGRASSDYHEACWLCRCDCGEEVIVPASRLKLGKRKRCYDRNHGIKPGRQPGNSRGTVHKLTYQTWMRMRERCHNPNKSRWSDYGGRGITVCERWNDFNNFLEDMGERPSREYSIDRIDPDGNYEPGNCRWATDKEQRRNKTNTLYAEYQGKRWKLIELCESLGLPYQNVMGRYRNLGWSIEKALFDPIKTRKPYKKRIGVR